MCDVEEMKPKYFYFAFEKQRTLRKFVILTIYIELVYSQKCKGTIFLLDSFGYLNREKSLNLFHMLCHISVLLSKYFYRGKDRISVSIT